MSPRKFKQMRIREALRLRGERTSSGGNLRSPRRIRARFRMPRDVNVSEPEVEAILGDIGTDPEEISCRHPEVVHDKTEPDGSTLGRCEACGEDSFMLCDVPSEAMTIANGGDSPYGRARRTHGRAWHRRLDQQRWKQAARKYLSAKRVKS